jgi:uncharacterized protein YaeQ
MAIKATIFKAILNVADMDRQHYGEYNLTIARHPSENDQRMMVRVLAYAMFAEERLECGRVISADDEPALWLKDYGGDVQLWIEVGLPEERLLRRASGRAEQVVVLAYGGRGMDAWWLKEGGAISRLENVKVYALSEELCEALTALAANRSMQLQATIQDGQIWLNAGDESVLIQPELLTPDNR